MIPTPSSNRNHLQAGRYRLELTLTARDVDATKYVIELAFDGTWKPDGTIWKHFNLEGLRQLR